ncbi:MAG: serine/threonine protein kinase [Phycisphaerae bacterium]
MGDASADRFLGEVSTRLSEQQTITETAGSRIGPYKLLQKIGEGGFGVVFLAEQEKPVRRKVALKIIKPGMDSKQIIGRFEAERQVLALMDHPHIARVFDGGLTESQRPFFVMEYVIGDPVNAFADMHQLTLRQRLDLFQQVCNAVQHAHTKGIIHRDLKPGNVLVSMTDGKPFAKVIDFGIAKATGAAGGRLSEVTFFTEHKQLIGTPEYMSPEQVEGSPDIDTRTDVYALGVLLYELLTGLTPFDRKRLRSAALAEMQRIIKEEEPIAPSVRLQRGTEGGDEPGASSPSLRASVPSCLRASSSSSPSLRASVPSCLRASSLKGELDWIVLKALEKDRARRYESPSHFAADIQRHLSGEPVVAAPPSMAYRVRKFVRKHRTAVMTGSMVAAALTLGIAGTTWQWSNADRIKRELSRQRESGISVLKASILRYWPEPESNDQPIGAQIFVLSDKSLVMALKSSDGKNTLTLTGAPTLRPEFDGPDAIEEYRLDSTKFIEVLRILVDSAQRRLEESNAQLREQVRRAQLAEASAMYVRWAPKPGFDLGWLDDPNATEIAQLQHAFATRDEILGPLHHSTIAALWMLGKAQINHGDSFGVELLRDAIERKELMELDGNLISAFCTLIREAERQGRLDLLEWGLRKVAREIPRLCQDEWVFVLNLHGDGACGPVGSLYVQPTLAQMMYMGRYRLEDYDEALKVLTESVATDLEGNAKGYHAAYTAMTLFQLGETASARNTLAQLRTWMSDSANADSWAHDFHMQRLLAEAEVLIDSMPTRPKP